MTSGGIDWQREKWQSGLGSKFIHQGEKNAVKYADEVLVLSKGVQDYFKETYGRETHFIPNGVNRPQIREASLITDKFGLKKDSLTYVLLLDRMTLSQKNSWVDAQGRAYVLYPLAGLAADLQSSISSVTRALRELEAARLIERRSNGFSKPNQIFLGVPRTAQKCSIGMVKNEQPDCSKVSNTIAQNCIPNQINKNNLRLNQLNRTKEAYGRYRNVYLEDYSELKMEIAELDSLIDDLSIYMQSTGRKYADHAATLRSWSARKKRQQKPGAGIPDYTYNKEESL